MSNLHLKTLRSSIVTLKRTFADILNYFLQDAEVQNIVAGCIVALQITSFVTKQVYYRAYLSLSSVLHASSARAFDKDVWA